MSGIQSIAAHWGAGVRAAIRDASERTATDFDFLLSQARVESALDPKAKARTSSAAGLFQFTNATWLETLKRHGNEHGYGWAANAISTEGRQARITDPQLAGAIMQLRFDPRASSLMAGELAGDNASFLGNALGRPVDNTELYLAHFLGAEGARKFISAHDANPGQPAASLFPQAARANRNVFYSGGGNARSLGEVREMFAAKLARREPAASGSALPVGSPGGNYAARDAILPPPLADKAGSRPRSSMAEILQSTLGAAGNGKSSAPAHVTRAYEQFARFGL